MKKTVLTITLNPAVDKSSAVKGIIAEKKLRCDPPKYEPGGGGINVSRALKRLGTASETLFLYGGKTGHLLVELLEQEQLHVMPLSIGGETRENFIVVDTTNNQQYRFGFPGDKISVEEQQHIISTIHEINEFPELVVISGSLPPGVAPSFLRKLIRLCKSKGSKVILDSSGEALKEGLAEGVFLIKPNIGELAAFSGIDELDETSVDEATRKIIADGRTEMIVVSLGAQGAVLYTETAKIQVSAPVVKKRSTVGAGDSMVAGMVAILANGGTSADMLRMGVACGSATTMAEGTGLFQKKDVDRLYQQIQKING
ncbi:1-phosphofructokinase family hexose kinase [Olivibacter sp. SDN3]|uniref:1-phosphofructokinase family hexose kinase n=1 Tax=Olivibacter sp. SDN3 TaxID=2764720 RepID=UPI0016513720|nr:1-phosphofructokinase family hexose kinase [Olivibacter sp. SDN3]QNL49796.1 1-phosphofructokinase family hexose kinase [Olivibacter sp. SDN3]